MESSILPRAEPKSSSPPAAYWATQGKMSFRASCSRARSAHGSASAITYWVAPKLGALFIERFGKWVHITPEKSTGRSGSCIATKQAASSSRACFPSSGTYLHPAGIIKMNFLTFSVITTVIRSWLLVLAKFSVHAFEKHPRWNRRRSEAMVKLSIELPAARRRYPGSACAPLPRDAAHRAEDGGVRAGGSRCGDRFAGGAARN